MHSLTSFDGTVFADIDWDAGFPQATISGQWDVIKGMTPRPGNTAIIAAGPISPRRVSVVFVYTGSGDVRAAKDVLVGLLDPRDQTPRTLIGERYDATEVQLTAYCEMPSGFSDADEVNTVNAVFVSADPAWEAVNESTEAASDTVSPFELAFTNDGKATVYPRYRVRWLDQHSANGTVVGQQYRKTLTLENTTGRRLAKFPFEINLGDTAALVSGGKAQADGDDLRVILNGQDMTRKLVGWGLIQSYVWIVIPGMAGDETLTIDVVYGNASATSPPVWTDPDPDKPVINMANEAVTATGGSTTTLVKAAWGLSVSGSHQQYRRAWVTGLTGNALNIGVTREVQSHTSDTLTFTSAWPAAIANTHTFLLRTSSNDRWNYDVRQVDRNSDYARGRFYIDKATVTPNNVDFGSPAAWGLALVTDNRDTFGVKRFTNVDVGGGDLDPFSIINAQRTWEGKDDKISNPGTADGLMIVTPTSIDQIYWEAELKNPNSMCKLFIGVRGSGAEDWAEVFTDSTALTALAVVSGTGFLAIEGDWPNVHQMVHALIPVNDIGIDPDWRRDTGSATAGTTTTTTDASKEWATDQFDNGYILMTSGANEGRKKAISSNTGTVITHSAFPTASADGDRYLVQNKYLECNLRDGGFLVVDINSAELVNSGLGSEAAVYDAAMTLWVGDGPTGDPAGQHRALIGYANAERRLFLAEDEEVEIDAALRRVRIWNTTDEGYTRELTDPTVVVQYHNGTEWVKSATWLPIGTDAQSVWISETNMGEIEVDVTYHAAFLGA